MVPLKVQSLLLMKSNKQTNNQSKEQDGMVPLKVRNDSPLISMYGQFLLRKPSLVKTHFHIFLVSLKGGHWPCHLLNVVQSCGKSLGWRHSRLANLIRPPAKINIQAFLAFTQTLSLNSSSHHQLTHIFRGDGFTHPC